MVPTWFKCGPNRVLNITYSMVVSRPLHFLKFDDQEDMCRDLTPKNVLSYDTYTVFSVSAKRQQILIGFMRNVLGEDMTWFGETMQNSSNGFKSITVALKVTHWLAIHFCFTIILEPLRRI